MDKNILLEKFIANDLSTEEWKEVDYLIKTDSVFAEEFAQLSAAKSAARAPQRQALHDRYDKTLKSEQRGRYLRLGVFAALFIGLGWIVTRPSTCLSEQEKTDTISFYADLLVKKAETLTWSANLIAGNYDEAHKQLKGAYEALDTRQMAMEQDVVFNYAMLELLRGDGVASSILQNLDKDKRYPLEVLQALQQCEEEQAKSLYKKNRQVIGNLLPNTIKERLR